MPVMRLISNSRSGIKDMNARELKAAIKGSEGRVVVSQLNTHSTVLNDVTNPELAQAMGADMIMVNCYNMDPENPDPNVNNGTAAADGWTIQEYQGKEKGWVNKTGRIFQQGARRSKRTLPS